MNHYFAEQLNLLKHKNQFRCLPELAHKGKWIEREGRTMLNLSSNDYLGLASDRELQSEFLQNMAQNYPLTSSSSRLLTGNFPIYGELEQLLAQRFGRESALLFNSGYHANIGILPAIATRKTLIVADKFIHASLIDGIRLAQASCQCDFIRYRHNDLEHLRQILTTKSELAERIIIVTESLFSMDGDITDLQALVQLKKEFGNIMLYVDEAHAIGVYGKQGLGIAESQNCLDDIDFLVGTFGKALASMGAYLVCDEVIKEYLINTMRPLIFSTNLPPINVAWTAFLFEKLTAWKDKRQHLAQMSEQLRQTIYAISPHLSHSHIVPYILGDNGKTLEIAKRLQQHGFYCLPIRPPTVPANTARIRLSLTAEMTADELAQFLNILGKYQ